MNALEALKKVDRNEILMLIKRDEDAKKVLIAWMAVKPPVLMCHEETSLDLTKATLAELVKAVWMGFPIKAVPFEEMAILSGVPKTTTKLKWDQLRRAGLIYPDGNVSEKALLVIKGEVGAYIRGMTSGS